MNAYNKMIIVLCAFLFTVSYSHSQQVTQAYNYPVRPGMDEWKKFQSQDEMIAACQVPDSILKTLTTEALVATCLNYPLYPQINAYNSTQAGFDRLASKFNGFQEVFARDDAFDAIFNTYKEMDPQGYSNDWTSVQKGRYVQKFQFIEILLSQNEITGTITSEKRQQIANECRKKYDKKLADADFFGRVGLSHTAYLIINVLNPTSQGLDPNSPVFLFSKTGVGSDPIVIEEVSSLLNNYLRNK